MMNEWRMAFRNGDNGESFWPQCKRLGVAAISYYPLGRRDLSGLSLEQFRSLAADLAPSQKASLRRVRHEMKSGDVIYVKDGPEIVGKGKVTGPYRFDAQHRIRDNDGNRWSHQVPVKWDRSFRPIRFSLGPEPRQTVAKLSPQDVEDIENELRTTQNNATNSWNGRGSGRTWWVYKCNNRRHPDQVVFGDWSDFFIQKSSMEWGSTEWVPDLARLSPGDLIIATQTDRNELVGLAEVVRFRRRSGYKDVHLRPLTEIGVKIRPLKKANASVNQIPALRPGPIQTLYDITAQDAALLLQAAGLNPSTLNDRQVPINGEAPRREVKFQEGEEAVIQSIRRTRSAKLRAEAIRHWGTKCSCCGFDFGEFYGPSAEGYIQVHHRKAISRTNGPVKNTVGDVQVVCANCHVVLHLNPPIEVHELRATLRRKHRSRG